MAPVGLNVFFALPIRHARLALSAEKMLATPPISVNPTINASLAKPVPISRDPHPARNLFRGVMLSEPVEEVLLQRWIILNDQRVYLGSLSPAPRLRVSMSFVIVRV